MSILKLEVAFTDFQKPLFTMLTCDVPFSCIEYSTLAFKKNSMSNLAEEGSAVLRHLRCVLVELQWLRELVHEEVGLIWLLLRKILHLALQEHQTAVPCIQLIPHMLENRESTAQYM